MTATKLHQKGSWRINTLTSLSSCLLPSCQSLPLSEPVGSQASMEPLDGIPPGFVAGQEVNLKGQMEEDIQHTKPQNPGQALCFSYVENITFIVAQLYSQPTAIMCFTDDPTMLVDKELSTNHLPLWWACSFLLKLILSIFQIIFQESKAKRTI